MIARATSTIRAGTRHTLHAMRLRIALVLLAVVVLPGLAACGEDSKTPLETVRAAAEETSAQPFAFVMTMSADEGPLAGGIDVEGVFDPGARLASAEVDASQFGLPNGGTIEVVYSFADGFVSYMNVTELFGEPPAELEGVEWLVMDIGELARQSGLDVDFASIMQNMSNNPASGVEILRGATKVTEVGTEEVRGVETTHYDVVIDLDRVVEKAPSDVREDLAKLADLYKVKQVTLDVWIDDDDRVRRYEQEQDTADFDLPASVQANNPFSGVLTIRGEYFDFGTDVEVRVPSEDETISFTELMRRVGGG